MNATQTTQTANKMVKRTCAVCYERISVSIQSIQYDCDGDEYGVLCPECLARAERYDDMKADAAWLGHTF